MNLKRIAKIAATILIVGAYASSVLADNRLVPFQGRLTDGNAQAVNDVERITFVIYDEPTGGTPLWQEIHDEVSIVGGQINVLLGSKSNLDDPNQNGNSEDQVNFTQARYLGITIGADSNQEMVPRHQLVPSFHARSADNSLNLNNKPASYYALAHAQTPLGSIVAWYKNFKNISTVFPDGWVEMNGQVIDDAESPFHGEFVPNLNGEKRFLRGGTEAGVLEDDALQNHIHNFVGTRGTTEGPSVGNIPARSYADSHNNLDREPGRFGPHQNEETHNHGFTPSGTISNPSSGRTADETRPINMSVVWIIRIK